MAAGVGEAIDHAIDCLELAHSAYRNGDWLGVLRGLGNANGLFAEAATVMAQRAYNEGVTKKAIAQALDIPPSTLRGMAKGDDPTSLEVER